MAIEKYIRGINWSPKTVDGWPAWRTFIYTLTDPLTSEICYVGKTDNVEKRYAQHINLKNMSGTLQKYYWLHNLIYTRASRPVMTVIEDVEPLEAGEAELTAIYRCWDEGAPLLNRVSEKKVPTCIYYARIAAARIQTEYNFMDLTWHLHKIQGCQHCFSIRSHLRKWLECAYEQGRKTRDSKRRFLTTSPY